MQLDRLFHSPDIAQVVLQDSFELIQRLAPLVDNPVGLDPDMVALDAHPVPFPPVSPFRPVVDDEAGDVGVIFARELDVL